MILEKKSADDNKSTQKYLVCIVKATMATKLSFFLRHKIFKLWHVTSNNVVFWQVVTRTSLCSFLLSLETPNGVLSVA